MANPIASAQKYFGVPDDYRTTADFFPESEADTAWRNTLEGNQQEALPAAQDDEFDDSDWQVAQRTGDPFKVFELAGKLREEAQANKIVQSFSKINPRMPDFLEKQNEILASNPYGITHPAVRNLQQINNSRAALVTPKAPSSPLPKLRMQAAEAGIDPSTFGRFVDPKTGELDPERLAYEIGNVTRKGKAESKPVRSDLISPGADQKKALFDEVDNFTKEPTDAEKIEAYNAANKTNLGGFFTPKLSPDQWAQAYDLAKASKLAKLQGVITSLHQKGIKLPKEVEQTAQMDVQPTTSFNTVEEADASGLPKGTLITIGGRKARID